MADKIVRSLDQITLLVDTIERELAELPPYNVFGEPNKDNVHEMRTIVADLRLALRDTLTDNTWGEAYYWLTGRSDTLGNDYGLGS